MGLLERIVDLLEKIEANTRPVQAVVEQPRKPGRPPKVIQPAKVEVQDGVVTVAAAPVVETRETPTLPISSTLENTIKVDEPVDFLTQATVVATATLDDVRKALSDLVTRKGGKEAGGLDAAYKVLKNAGNAERLPGSPRDQEVGANAPGGLKPEFYQAVIDAAKKA